MTQPLREPSAPPAAAGRDPKRNPGRRATDGSGVAPNYALLVIGLVVLAGATALLFVPDVATRTKGMPVFGALLMALGFALALFGAFPSADVARGRIYGFRVIGPAAVAIPTFLMLRRQKEDLGRDYIVLQNLNGNTLSRASLGPHERIELRDVDSFSDDKLESVLDKLVSSLAVGRDSSALRTAVRKQFDALRLGARATAIADSLVQAYQRGESVDGAWRNLVDAAPAWTNDALLRDRIKKQPYAVVAITDTAGTRHELVAAGEPIQVGAERYAVPIIANPALKSTHSLVEAVVLQRVEP